MTTAEITLATTDGPVTVTAVHCGPYAVHRTLHCDNPACGCARRPRWTITHRASGYALALCRSGPDALTIARAWAASGLPCPATVEAWRANAMEISAAMVAVAARLDIYYVWARYAPLHR